MFRCGRMVPECHEDSVWAVDWCHGANVIISGGIDNAVCLWDGEQLQAQNQKDETNISPLAEFDRHSLAVSSVSVSPKSTNAVSASLDGSIGVYDLEKKVMSRFIELGPTEAFSVALNDCGDRFVTGNSRGFINMFSCESGEKLSSTNVSDNFVLRVIYSADRVLSGTNKGEISVLDTTTGAVSQRFRSAHLSGVRCLEMIDDNTFLSGGEDYSIGLFDIRSGEKVASMTRHNSWVLDVAFAPNPSASVERFVSCSGDGTVKVWELRMREVVHTFPCPNEEEDAIDEVWSLAFGPSGTDLVSASSSVFLFSISDK